MATIACTPIMSILVFFFNAAATPEIYTLSLHDALPISTSPIAWCSARWPPGSCWARSEEHTSELQSRLHLVCRLLLEKKKTITGRLLIGYHLITAISILGGAAQCSSMYPARRLRSWRSR